MACILAFVACGAGGPPPLVEPGLFAECSTAEATESVSPTVACQLTTGDTKTVVFGYRNDQPTTVVVPAGDQNHYEPELGAPSASGAVRPPSSFLPGEHPLAFAVTYKTSVGVVRWKIGKTKSVSSSDAVVECKSEVTAGETRLTPKDAADGTGSIVTARDPAVRLANTVVPTAAPTQNGALGETAGSLTAGKDGSASYFIPIEVPPGRAGMAPELSLTYNSRAGNGPLGVGWSIGGLSQIARCPKPATKDAKAAPVKFSLDDELCIDGDPITRYAVSNDGTLAVQFRAPLHDPYTRIKAIESDAGGVTAFSVELRNGRILRYGGAGAVVEGIRAKPAADGKGEEQQLGTVRLAWLLSEVRDRNDNAIWYSYDDASIKPTPPQGCAFGGPVPCNSYETRIRSITYTHNADGSGGLKSVEFQWDDGRPDEDLVWVSGLALKRRGRLREITISGPAPVTTRPLHRYQFQYVMGPVSGRSLLSSVRECDGASACKSPTTFDYQRGDAGPETADFNEIRPLGQFTGWLPFTRLPGAYVFAADFNGDGLDDVLVSPANSSSWKVAINQTVPGSASVKFGAPIAVNLPTNSSLPPAPTPVDLDHDGSVDLIYPQLKIVKQGDDCLPVERLAYRRLRWSGSDFVPAPGDPGEPKSYTGKYTCSGASSGGTYFVDRKGDGRLEQFSLSATSYGPLAAPTNGSRAWDIFEPKFGHFVRWLDPTPVASSPKEETPLVPGQDIAFGDVNADGMADALMRKPSTDQSVLLMSTGLGFRPIAVPAPLDGTDAPTRWTNTPSAARIDFYQDGHSVWLVDPSNLSGGTFAATRRTMLRSLPFKEPEWRYPPTIELVGSGRVGLTAFGVPVQAFDANGDGVEDLLFADSTGSLSIALRNGQRADLLVRVITGFGDRADVTYAPLPARIGMASVVCNDSNGIDCSQRGILVVDRLRRHVDFAERSSRYTFTQPWTDFVNGNFLGFGSMVELDEQTGRKTTTHFDKRDTQVTEDGFLRFPYGQVPTSIEAEAPVGDGRVMRSVTAITWGTPDELRSFRPAGSQSFQPLAVLIDQTSTEESPKGITILQQTSSLRSYDRYGNLTTQTSTSALAKDKETTFSTWATDEKAWLISQPRSTRVTSTVEGKSTARLILFETDARTGLLTREIVEPTGTADVKLFTDVIRNANGNVVATVVSDTTGLRRRTDIEWDALDQTFPTREVDALGHVSEVLHHPGLGVVAETVDANGVRRRFRYDGFGRLRRVMAPLCSAPDLTGTGCSGPTTTIEELPPSIPKTAFAIRMSQSGGPTSIIHYDQLGREVRTDVTGFDGKPVTTVTAYDSRFLGQPSSVSEVILPGFLTPLPLVARTSRFGYDLLGRTVQSIAPNGGKTTRSYEGRRVVVTDPMGSETITETDPMGRVTSHIELLSPTSGPPFGGPPLGSDREIRTRYTYGPFGQMLTVTDTKSNKTNFEYDTLGRKTALVGPRGDRTTWTYNAFGEPIRETHGALRERSFAYDALGRPVAEKAADGVACLYYDGAPNGIGQLTSSRRFDGSGADAVRVEHSTAFDPLGRPIVTRESVGGGPELTFAHKYDAFGRLSQVDYPSASGDTGLSVGYFYNSFGHLQRLLDLSASGAGSTSGKFGPPQPVPILWEALETDVTGQLTKERFENGVTTEYTYDVEKGYLQKTTAQNLAGVTVQDLAYQWYDDYRLKVRDDRSVGTLRSDRYKYDSVKRIVSWSGGWGEVSYDYDDIGNLKKRTTKAKGTKVEHFVSGGFLAPGEPGISPSPYAITAGPEGSYTYDEVGDQVSFVPADGKASGRSVQWTTFHLPRRVVTDVATASYNYDAHRHRARKVEENSGTITYYAGGGLYELRRTGEIDEELFSVAAGERTIAQIIRTKRAGLQVAKRKLFIHPDHLGSPHVITDEFGKQLEVRVHEPFGRRVDPIDPTKPFASTTAASAIHEGFTGHQHEDELSLINMRGRIYDPKVGRFLSADPILGTSGQRLNRYSYVANDPINQTDPSGFCFDTLYGCLANPPAGASGISGSIQWGFGGPPAEPEPIGNDSKGKPAPPAAAAPKPTLFAPSAPINAGSGPMVPLSIGGFLGFSAPTLGGAYKLAGASGGRATSGALPVVRSSDNLDGGSAVPAPRHQNLGSGFRFGSASEDDFDPLTRRFVMKSDQMIAVYGAISVGALATAFPPLGYGMAAAGLLGVSSDDDPDLAMAVVGAVGLRFRALPGVGGGSRIVQPLSEAAKTELRTSARQIWFDRMGQSASRAGLDVHHRIPLEYAHLFPAADPNRAANLIGVATHTHSEITSAWNGWRQSLGRAPKPAEVMGFASAIDSMFAEDMVFIK